MHLLTFSPLVRLAALAALVSACSDDAPLATGGAATAKALDAADSGLAGGDMADASLADTTLADTPLATQDAADIAQTATADAQAVDAAAEVSATVDAEAGPWPKALQGDWLDCAGRLRLNSDGSFAWQPYESTCSLSGTWSRSGGAVNFAGYSATSGCKAPTWLGQVKGYAVSADTLDFVLAQLSPGEGSFSRAPMQERWLLDSGTGSAVMDVCRDATGRFFAGRVRSPKCDFLACNARVTDRKIVGSELHFYTECTGSCPCVGLLDFATIQPTSMSGKYASGTCAGAASGQVQAMAAVFPTLTP